MPHLPQLDGTDSHLYFGWYHGDERDLAGLAAAVPRMVRFVSEFGAQAVPDTADFMDPERGRTSTGTTSSDITACRSDAFDERVPPERLRDVRRVARGDAAYQATLLRHHIETLRRLKYRPTGGFCFSWLADAGRR